MVHDAGQFDGHNAADQPDLIVFDGFNQNIDATGGSNGLNERATFDQGVLISDQEGNGIIDQNQTQRDHLLDESFSQTIGIYPDHGILAPDQAQNHAGNWFDSNVLAVIDINGFQTIFPPVVHNNIVHPIQMNSAEQFMQNEPPGMSAANIRNQNITDQNQIFVTANESMVEFKPIPPTIATLVEVRKHRDEIIEISDDDCSPKKIVMKEEDPNSELVSLRKENENLRIHCNALRSKVLNQIWNPIASSTMSQRNDTDSDKVSSSINQSYDADSEKENSSF